MELLKEILDTVQGRDVHIRPASAFSHENVSYNALVLPFLDPNSLISTRQMYAALAGLEDAVRNHDKQLATENARAVVLEAQQAGSEPLKAKTKEVVQATINALSAEDAKQEELSRAMAELKELAAQVEGCGVDGGEMRQNDTLRRKLVQASKNISNNVEDLFSPRSERFNHL